jgi:hypothetical protein
MFRLDSDGPVFGAELVAALDALAAFHRADADTLNVLALAGSGDDDDDSTSGHSFEAVLERQERRHEAESVIAGQLVQGRKVCLALLDAANHFMMAEMTRLRGRKIHGAAVRNAEHSRQEALRDGQANANAMAITNAPVDSGPSAPELPRTASGVGVGGGGKGGNYAGSYADTGYTVEELRDMLSGGDADISQTAEGAQLSVQLLEEREKQVRNTVSLVTTFNAKSDRFTKTCSGQTQGKHSKF